MRELHKKTDIDVVSKLALYQQYNVDRIPPFVLLCKHPSSLTREEAKILGLDTTVLISATRQALSGKPLERRFVPIACRNTRGRCIPGLGVVDGAGGGFNEEVYGERSVFINLRAVFMLTFAMVSAAPPNTNRVKKSKGRRSARSRRCRHEHYHQA